MTPSRAEIETVVVGIVASALEKDTSEVRAHASLIDDLGAESIDFLDIVFRLESAFQIKIADDDIWRGEFDLLHAAPDQRREALRQMRQAMPDYRWDRFPDQPSDKDLPRLITVRTIVDYLERTVGRVEAAP